MANIPTGTVKYICVYHQRKISRKWIVVRTFWPKIFNETDLGNKCIFI